MRMTGKQAFLDVLRQEGVSVLIGNPGTTELPLMDALVREPRIRYVLALQEAVALSMADGYALASGGLGVVNLHTSPGLGNAMGMLYNALRSGAPLLVTAGQHDQSFAATEPILWSDLPPVARPWVKWSAEIHRLEDLPRLVHRAAKTALAHPTGPVFLSIPGDVLEAERDLELGGPTRVAPRAVGDRAGVQHAAERLVRAERPVIVAGDAVAHGDALAELVELAELLGSPVFLEGLASACNFPFTHPLYAGALSRLAPQIRGALMPHDLVCSIGGDLFTLSLPSEVDPMPPGLEVVHLDVDPWELGKNYATAVAIQGDPKATLPELGEAVRRLTSARGHRDAARRLEAARALHERERADLWRRADADADRTPMSPLSLVAAIARAVPPETVIVDESISSAGGIRQLFRCADAKSFFGMRGGGIGWGLPAAFGVKLGLADRPVVALLGDGSALYTNQALWTAARESLAVAVVIFNNRSYRILKQRIRALKGFAAEDERYVGLDLDRPAIDWIGLARSLGVPGERVEKVSDVEPAIQRALATHGPYVIDADVDPAL